MATTALVKQCKNQEPRREGPQGFDIFQYTPNSIFGYSCRHTASCWPPTNSVFCSARTATSSVAASNPTLLTLIIKLDSWCWLNVRDLAARFASPATGAAALDCGASKRSTCNPMLSCCGLCSSWDLVPEGYNELSVAEVGGLAPPLCMPAACVTCVLTAVRCLCSHPCSCNSCMPTAQTSMVVG